MDPEVPLDAFGSLSAPQTAPLDSSVSPATPSTAAATAAADPSQGAGWRQTAKQIGDLFGNTVGSLRVQNGQLAPQGQGQQQQRPQQQQPGGTQGPASGSPTLSQQAQALLAKGLISQEQYQKIMASIGGTVPSTGMPEMIASQGTPAVGGAQGAGAPFTGAMNPVNGPSPISPAWGG